MERANTNLLEAVDARTKLAGSNRMEILLFSLGTSEIFGINVFKVREVCRTPFITKAPNMPGGVEGLISLRGNVIPVLSLAKVLGLARAGQPLGSSMMVTEYSKRTLGFLVEGVDRIIRVEWDKVRQPENMAGTTQGYITAITELADGKLVSILDVETILSQTFGEAPVGQIMSLDKGVEASMGRVARAVLEAIVRPGLLPRAIDFVADFPVLYAVALLDVRPAHPVGRLGRRAGAEVDGNHRLCADLAGEADKLGEA
jgi:two-component system chemotaxis response regulator CheV